MYNIVFISVSLHNVNRTCLRVLRGFVPSLFQLVTVKLSIINKVFQINAGYLDNLQLHSSVSVVVIFV